MKSYKNYWLMCNCMNHAIQIEKDDDQLSYLSMWYFGSHPHFVSLWWRIKTAFRFIFNKSLYADQLVLDKEDVRKLKRILDELYDDEVDKEIKDIGKMKIKVGKL